MKPRTLHAGIIAGWGYIIWLEHHVDFEFTGRIKYTHEYGAFKDMYLEIERPGSERYWYSFWKKTPVTYLDWIASDNIEYIHPHDNITESTIVECENVE
jgi:hypothetical protein